MTDLTIETIESLMVVARSSDAKPDNGKYYVAIPSRSLALLIMIGAKARWKAEYRRQRMEAKGLTDHAVTGSLGAWQGFTFESIN